MLLATCGSGIGYALEPVADAFQPGGDSAWYKREVSTGHSGTNARSVLAILVQTRGQYGHRRAKVGTE
eukprot:473062-Rhodomonas_salina.4